MQLENDQMSNISLGELESVSALSEISEKQDIQESIQDFKIPKSNFIIYIKIIFVVRESNYHY